MWYSVSCISDQFRPLTDVTLIDELFDDFPCLLQIVLSVDEFGSFRYSAVSRMWGSGGVMP